MSAVTKLSLSLLLDTFTSLLVLLQRYNRLDGARTSDRPSRTCVMHDRDRRICMHVADDVSHVHHIVRPGLTQSACMHPDRVHPTSSLGPGAGRPVLLTDRTCLCFILRFRLAADNSRRTGSAVTGQIKTRGPCPVQ